MAGSVSTLWDQTSSQMQGMVVPSLPDTQLRRGLKWGWWGCAGEAPVATGVGINLPCPTSVVTELW